MLSCRLVNHSILPNINLYSMEVTPWETIDSKRAYPAPDGGLFRWEPKNPNSQPDMMYYFFAIYHVYHHKKPNRVAIHYPLYNHRR